MISPRSSCAKLGDEDPINIRQWMMIIGKINGVCETSLGNKP